jgi:predicted PurR-regulated permease PerM
MFNKTANSPMRTASATSEDESAGASPERVVSRQAAARLAFGVAMAVLALWIFAEYLPALGWAGVIAIATWPFYKRMRARLRNGRLAHAMPALFAVLIGLVVLAPVIGAGWVASREAEAASHWLEEARESGVAPPDWLDKLEYVGPSMTAWWRQNLADPQSAASLIKGIDKAPLIAVSEHIGVAAGRRLVLFLFTLLALFFMYRDGDELAASLRRLSERAFGPRGRAIGERIVNSVHGTVDGLVLVGLGEGLVLTVAYYFAGVPQVVLMGVATAIGCIVPFGAFVMFSLASLLLLYKGATFAAIVIFVLGIAVLTVADHVVRPYVIGTATRLPFLFVLVGIIGGVEAFGMLGLFLGPAIMAILVDLWREATA